MKYPLIIACALLFSLSAVAQDSQANDHKSSIPSAVEILSDTRGVDFGPYLGDVLKKVRENWYKVIPEVARPPIMKKGKVSIAFAIKKDGGVKDMRLLSPSGDLSLDRAAWSGIEASVPFASLPTEFNGDYLALRFHFYYNPDRGSVDSSPNPSAPEPKVEILSDTRGVDFGPYLGRVLHDVTRNWHMLMPPVARPPQMKQGDVTVEFAILKDGTVKEVALAKSSQDVSMDRAAWGGITGSTPFPPLPAEFGGDKLQLRFQFQYNPEQNSSKETSPRSDPDPKN